MSITVNETAVTVTPTEDIEVVTLSINVVGWAESDPQWNAEKADYLKIEDFNDTISENDDVLSAVNHIANTSNPHSVTKSQVGLGNVPNTDATNRTNHTGTQTASTISDFDTAIAAYLAGAISTALTSNLTASRALESNGSGKIAVSTVTSTELGYVAGVTSAIQTQINDINTSVNGRSLALKSFAETTWNNDNTKRLILTYNVPANFLWTGSVAQLVEFEIDTGVLNNTGSNQTYTVEVKYGSSTLIAASSTGNIPSNSNERPGKILGWIKGITATTQKAAVKHGCGGIVDSSLFGSSSNEDSSTVKDLTISVTLGTASSSFSFRVCNSFVRKVTA